VDWRAYTNYTRGYHYDEFGNNSVQSYTGISPIGFAPTTAGGNPFNPASNHQIAIDMAGGYDARGMVTKLGSGTVQMAYDADGNMKNTSDTNTGQSVSLVFDAEGQRAQKLISGGSWTLFVHDAFGQLAASYNNNGVTAACNGTCYLTYDMLGSVRLVTDTNQNLVARHDFIPFGEEIPNGTAGRVGSFGATSNVKQGFTGQEADGGTAQLDFYNARHFAATIASFVQPDPMNAGADITSPQSWNAYAYVLGNPLGFTDPSGADPILTVPCSLCSVTVSGTPDPLDNSWWSGGQYSFTYYTGANFSVTRTGVADRNPPTISASVSSTLSLPKSGTCSSGSGSNAGSAWSEMFSALGSWLTSGPKYIHYGPSDPYTTNFMKSNAMLYVNNRISGSQASSGRVAVGTGRAFLFTVLDAMGGSPSISEAQLGAFVATYSRSGSGMEINISNDISINSALFHIPSGLSMSGSYADRFGRRAGQVWGGAVLQEMTIHQCH
jgi:RHS repeat-associated protein